MYSINDFGWMIRDKIRMEAYSRALQAAITPGCIVGDIGAGTGIFSLLACQYGAGKVYAIEPNDSILLARQFAKDNGYSERIEFIQGFSTDVDLDQKADVVIADLRGVLPLYNGNIDSMIDARDRLLAPGGCLIPERDILFAAICENQADQSEIEEPWKQNDFGLNLSAGSRFVANSWRKRKSHELSLLSAAQQWGVIDYKTVKHPGLKGEVSLTIESDGEAAGVSVWFDSEIYKGLGFSNSPDRPELVYRGAQFPWPKPVRLIRGSRVVIALEAKRMGADYVWIWNTKIFTSGNDVTPIEIFRQSSFQGQLISPLRLAKRAGGYKPVLNLAGKVEAMVFGLMDGLNSLDEIAMQVSRHFPEKYGEPQAAAAKVSELSARFSDKNIPES